MNDTTDMMAHTQSHSSIRLPKGFEFHYTDGQQDPQTPDSQSELGDCATAPPPPPPPKQVFKVRRRRTDAMHELASDHAPLPTIEMCESSEALQECLEPTRLPGYLAARPSYLRLVSPPRTPAAQLTTYNTQDLRLSEWSMLDDLNGNLIERPSSACSDFSDSSASSFGSSNLSFSLGGGSCTSPESDAADPFSFYEVKSGPSTGSQLPASTDAPTAKRVKTSRHPKWTPEMDNHLWITYMIYVQDPRATPFKMLPGTPPPLGVCHRVAREARRTWRGNRASHNERSIPRISIQHPGSSDVFNLPEDRSTPTPSDFRPHLSLKWPRSEAATRRRLRELCKRKPSLSAHYMRLLSTRSPSPFESSSSSPQPQPQPEPLAHPTPEATSSFSSRDMSLSLATSASSSMQADGPLAQLFHEPKVQTPAPSVQRPAEWFTRIGRSQARAQAHQKSQSLQLGLGLNTWSGPNTSFERGSILASPFDSEGGNDPFVQDSNATQSLGRGRFNKRPGTSSCIASPPEFRAPMPTVRSLKRRFGVDDENQASNQPSLQNLFATPASVMSRPPIRHRGFSLGDVGATAPNIAGFFTQSALPDQLMEEAPEIRPNTSYLATPQSQDPPRLGSPFSGGSSNNRFNTFPRSFTHQEPGGQEVTFEEKLRQLAAAAPRQT